MTFRKATGLATAAMILLVVLTVIGSVSIDSTVMRWAIVGVLVAEILVLIMLAVQRLSGLSLARNRSSKKSSEVTKDSVLFDLAVRQYDAGFTTHAVVEIKEILSRGILSRSRRSQAQELISQHHARNSASSSTQRHHYDVIITSNFNLPGGTSTSNLNEMQVLIDLGLSVGVIHNPLYGEHVDRQFNNAVASFMQQHDIPEIGPNAQVSCDRLLIRFPPCMQVLRDNIPKVDASQVILIVNQSPCMYYNAVHGVQEVWDIATVDGSIRNWVGDYSWATVGPQVHAALRQFHLQEIDGIELSDWYWYPTVEVPDEIPRIGPLNKDSRVVIGRHSRDHVSKWPELAADLRAAYPNDHQVDVRVLGGADSARKILGEIPSNWEVLEFNSEPIEEFLATLDVYSFFSNSATLEAFGRAPVEAMAAGIPVIVPHSFGSVFGEGAIYCKPDEVLTTATALVGNTNAYINQQKKGIKFVAENFGHESHKQRLNQKWFLMTE